MTSSHSCVPGDCVCVCGRGRGCSWCCSWADTPALNFRAITLSLRAWSAHHGCAGLFLRDDSLFMRPAPWGASCWSDLYLPCSPCRFQPASAFPALRAVPPGTSRTSSAGRSTRYPTWPGLPAVPPASALPVSRRSAGTWPFCSSCRFQPASAFPALPAAPPASALLLPLPVPAGPYPFIHILH